MSRLIAVFNVVVGLAMATIVLWRLSDHSWLDLFQWAMLFLVGIIQPMRWTRRTERLLGSLGVPIPRDLRTAALYPVVVGLLTIIVAISLISRARLQ